MDFQKRHKRSKYQIAHSKEPFYCLPSSGVPEPVRQVRPWPDHFLEEGYAELHCMSFLNVHTDIMMHTNVTPSLVPRPLSAFRYSRFSREITKAGSGLGTRVCDTGPYFVECELECAHKPQRRLHYFYSVDQEMHV